MRTTYFQKIQEATDVALFERAVRRYAESGKGRFKTVAGASVDSVEPAREAGEIPYDPLAPDASDRYAEILRRKDRKPVTRQMRLLRDY